MDFYEHYELRKMVGYYVRFVVAAILTIWLCVCGLAITPLITGVLTIVYAYKAAIRTVEYIIEHRHR